MTLPIRFICSLLMLMILTIPCLASAGEKINIPILCYHNLNPTVKGSMNLTPEKFEAQIKWIKDHGYTVIPLQQAVEYLNGSRDSLPPKPVVVTDDDGWQSVYTYMYPVIRKYKIPVTLFIYPGT